MALRWTLLTLLAFSSMGGALPLERRQKSSLKPTDEEILNYALTLEHLEAAFYRQGLENFTRGDFENAGYSLDVYSQVETIAKQEETHVSFYTKALTGKEHVELLPTFTPHRY